MEKVKLIGIVSSNSEDAYQIGQMLKGAGMVKMYENQIKYFASDVLGLTIEQLGDEKILNSYLPDRWSYVRQERFTGPKGVDIKPVKYHLTAEAVLKRIQFLGREIHSNFWVNSMFARYNKEENSNWIIIDVIYPNEADGIIDNGGLLFRVKRSGTRSHDRYLSTHPGITKTFECDGTNECLEKIANELKSYLWQ